MNTKSNINEKPLYHYVTSPLNKGSNIRPMKDSGIQWIGQIPEGWQCIKGKYLFRQRNSKGNSAAILLSATQKMGMCPQSMLEGVVQVNEGTDLNTFKTVHINDYVISLRSFQGGFEISGYEGVCSPAYQVFYSISEIDHSYYKKLFKSDGFISKMNSLTVGIREGKNIQYGDFANSLIPCPPLEEQSRIAAFLDEKCAAIDNVLEKTKASIEEYKKLKQSVITQAVTKGIRPNRQMKDSGIEWIGQIPEDWKVLKFKNLGVCRNGLTYSPDDMCDADNGTLVLRSSNIQEGKLVLEDCVYVKTPIKDELWVKEGDILICSRNGSAKLIGKNAIIPKNLKASFGAFMLIYRCQNPYYVKHILSSNVFLYNLSTFLTSTVNQLTNSNFLNIRFPYAPNKDEQQAIADYLDAKCTEIDNLIAKKEQFLKEIETYKKSLIYEYVTGKKEVL